MDQLQAVVEYFSQFDAFAFDVESIGPHRGIPAQNEVAWLSLATHGAAVVIPMAHPIGNRIIGEEKIPKTGKDGKVRNYKSPIWEPPPTQLRRSTVFGMLAPLFKSDRVKIAHNEPFDLVSVAKYLGFMPPPPYHDTIVSSWLLDENRLNGLKPRMKEDYGLDYDKENVGKQVEKFALSTVATYGRLDAIGPWLMYKRHRQLLAEEGLTDAWQLEMDVMAVVADMASVGAPISAAWLQHLRDDLSAELEDREADVYKAAGRILNISSPVQKSEVLYAPKQAGGQGLKITAYTPGGEKKRRAKAELTWADYSTDAAALKAHAKNPVAAAILAYQETAKLLSTYVNAYLGDDENPGLIFDGRIYASFLQYGTVTGRFSSRNPNLQNIPIRTKAGAKIRRSFEAAEGWSLIVADYSAIELVLLAHFAGDGLLKQGFLNGIDPHTVTATGILGKSPQELTGAERTIYGKTVNFLIGYGGGAKLLAEKAEIKLREAEEIIKQHQTQFPEIYAFKSRVIRTARNREPVPYVKTLSGRKRRVPDLHSPDDYKRFGAERQAVNSIIQGTAGDLNKMSMVRAYRGFKQAGIHDKARLVLTVHDEIVAEAHDSVLEQAEAIVREAMIGEEMKALIDVPLKADFEIVKDWSAAKS
ncbi:DNA polymerase [Streptosporangium sp. NPDC023825]|uniref:DNA polymerase n=1 Tax=Streptosporangium sp. NPDC023825 TaxID=3154909 RepID=UPI0034195D4A